MMLIDCRMLSMTLGRPPMVSVSLAESVSLPTDSDEDWDDIRGGRSGQTLGRDSEGPSILSFFTHSVKLYNIMHKILLSFYSDENIASSDDADRHCIGLESTLHIEQELSKWCRSIPDHLRMNPFVSSRQCDEQPPMFRRLGYILWARLAFMYSPSCTEYWHDTYPLLQVSSRSHLSLTAYLRQILHILPGCT